MLSKNIIINCMKRSLAGREIKRRVGAFKKIEALVKILLLLILDLLVGP